MPHIFDFMIILKYYFNPYKITQTYLIVGLHYVV